MFILKVSNRSRRQIHLLDGKLIDLELEDRPTPLFAPRQSLRGEPVRVPKETDLQYAVAAALVGRAIRAKSRDYARQALLYDPATQAVLNMKRIGQMFDEMWEAEQELLTYYE